VVIVEDHQMFREWLGRMISENGTFTVCGEADNIRNAMEIIRNTKPDVVILDLTLRGSSGLELLKDMKAQEIEIPVLVLSMHEESLYAERALRAGARGYISKHAASSTLLKALGKVMGGETYLDEATTSLILQKLVTTGGRKAGGVEALADRELEVLQLIGKGFATREIARQLSLGETTVETYRARIKEKLSLRNVAELYSFAARWLQERGG
jgi:DNA-binding NarL/FixJ family response regulator